MTAATEAAVGAAVGAGTGTVRAPTPAAPAGAGLPTDATCPVPGNGDASAMSNGGSDGPPGVATIETDVSASAWVSRFVG